MSSCCANKGCELTTLAERQAKVLWTVLVINATMFFIELASGLAAKSTSLTGDSLDMLGDTAAYAMTLFVIGKSSQAKARSARFKASLMLMSGLAITLSCLHRAFSPSIPVVEVMGVVAMLALFANLVCLLVLSRHKHDDINMQSVWLCSRNDIISNLSVIAATVLVKFTNSQWPDLVVGIGLSILFTYSALSVFRSTGSAVSTN